jgi:hypothetical protein
MRIRAPVAVWAGTLACAVAVGAAGCGSGSDPAGRATRAAASSRPPVRRPAAYRALTLILGVLRQPQTEPDRNPALLEQLTRETYRRTDRGLLGTPVISLVRLATIAPWGQKIFLIPYLPPTREQIAGLPARWRRGGEQVAHATVISVGFYPMSSGEAVPAVIEAGRAWASDSKRGDDYAGERFVMLFPDGVAKVALWNTTSIRAHPHPLVAPRSKPAIVTVHNNLAAFRSRTFHSPGHEVWYGPSGEIVKRIANASSCGPPLGNCA